MLFTPIEGVDSELDSFPVGESRKYWEPAALARADAARKTVEARYRDWLLASVEALLAAVREALKTSAFSESEWRGSCR